MPTTAVQQILDVIDARADNITVANGYNTNIAKKEASKLTAFVGGDWPQFSYWIVTKPVGEQSYGNQENELAIIVGYFDLTRDIPFSEMAALLEADVVIAMNRDITEPALSDAASFDLGGLVSDLIHNDTEYIIGEGETPWGGVLCLFTAKFMTVMNDPYTIIDDSAI